MAMTPEKKVKKKVVEELKKLGRELYYFFPMTGGYGRSGVPDIIGCYRGMFFAIECKAGKNTTTALQDREIEAIRTSKGLVLIVNEENVSNVALQIGTTWAWPDD
mgnify:FL=1